MALSNSWQNITNKDIAVSHTGSITLTVKFQLRDTHEQLL